ncbi:MAG: DUF3085 domain-containing protein [Rhodocyclaceae bacterium]|nr:DUF3085 domain-containing protein [Rhodocyclaceae bacterium]
MRVVLHFLVKDVLSQASHAVQSQTHRATQADLSDAAFFDAEPDANGAFNMATIRLDRIRPRLTLAKDRGCYLVSEGLPALMRDDRTPLVAYVLGLDHTIDQKRVDHVLGADKFEFPFPAQMFVDALRLANKAHAKYLRLASQDGQVELTHSGKSEDHLDDIRNFNN